MHTLNNYIFMFTHMQPLEDVEISPMQLTSGDYITSIPSSLRSDCLECICTGYTTEGGKYILYSIAV